MSLVDKLLLKPESATFADERQFWSIEKASNGQKYYFNKKTKESQWEKPECLKTEEEKENQTNWLECTKQDGRVFYYNTETKKSQWQIPEELKILRQQQAERRRIRESQGFEDDENEFTISDEQKKEIDQRNFLEMLRENKVTNQMKWDNAQKLMQNDQRWIKIKQISEKKRLFQDYIQKIKRMERQEQQNKSEKAKEDFFKLLEEQNFTSDAKFYKVVSSFAQDPRYRGLEEKNRELYYQDFMDRLYEQEQDQMKEERRIHGDILKRKKQILLIFENFNLIIYWEQNKKILQMTDLSTSFKWSEFQPKFRDDESFKKLSEFDKIYIFSEIIQDLQKVENDERRKTKRRNERINRENFRELLKQKIAQGEINHKTKWKNFVQTIKDSQQFLQMLDQPGSQPHELFEDQQDLLIENHKAMKAEIKQHIKQSGMKVVADITYREFIEKMKQLSVFDTLEEYLKNFYYYYFIQKAKLKEKETQKKHKKAQRKYLKFLKTLQELNKDSQYKDFQDIITKGLGEEINAQIPLTERDEIFKEYVATLDPNYKDLYNDQEVISQDIQKNHFSTISNNVINTLPPASAIVHNPPQVTKFEPQPNKKVQLNHKGNNEEGEEGEIPETEKKNKNKSDDEDGEQEEGEDKDSDSEQRNKDKKKKKSSHRHRDHHSSRTKNKRSRSRSSSRARQDKKNRKKDKKKKKSHKNSRSNSSSD